MKRVLMLSCAACLLWSGTSAHADDPLTFMDGRLKVGAELRLRYEVFSDFYTPDGASDLDDSRLLYRVRPYIDFRPDDDLQFFLELMDARQFGSDIIQRRASPNVFEDDIDFFQAFVHWKRVGGSPLSFKVGRQILSYGKQRLLGGFLWANTARSFDAAKMIVELDDFGGQIDVFGGQVVQQRWGKLNRVWGHDNNLYGIYSTWNQVPYVDLLDAYYLVRHNSPVDDEVHTLGIRAERAYDSGWDWEIEMAGQFGDFRGLDHTAFASRIETGYTFDIDWTPRLAAAYAFATGDDDPTDNRSRTFDNLFPTNHIHYGQMDLFSWKNVHSPELQLSAKPMDQLTTVVAVHGFFRAEKEDAWYNAGGGVIRGAVPAGRSYIGTEIDLRVNYAVHSWLTLEAGYSHFFAGDFVSDTGDSSDADWGYMMTTLTF